MKVSLCGEDDCPTPYEFCEACIRADERESVKAEYVPVLMEHLRILADLRGWVEALRDEAMDHNWPDSIVAYQTVLGIIDGRSEERRTA